MADAPAPARGTFFQRFLLPSLALKGVIIGGGYATGRELAEYFLSHGPVGAILAMIVATIVWSVVAAITFALAFQLRAYDYRTFMGELLGRGAIAFEICFLLFSVLLLAVFGAAAGEIATSVLGTPPLVGTLALAVCIAVICGIGEKAVETMFKYVSIALYSIYALFLVLALSSFGERIDAAFEAGGISPGWAVSGVTYGIYNIVGAVMILPVLRHLGSRRDGVIAGLIAGPMAMIPALAFVVAMAAFLPEILNERLPSDLLLERIGSPAFQVAFQLMVFGALLESGVGVIHALNERVARVIGDGEERPALRWFRPVFTVVVLAGCMFVANRIGLVDLIASGYRLMAFFFLFTFMLPVLTFGLIRLLRTSRRRTAIEDA